MRLPEPPPAPPADIDTRGLSCLALAIILPCFAAATVILTMFLVLAMEGWGG